MQESLEGRVITPDRDGGYYALNEIFEQLRQLEETGGDARRAHVYRNVIGIVLERHANEQSRNGEWQDHSVALFRGPACRIACAPGVWRRQAVLTGAGPVSQSHHPPHAMHTE